MQQIDHRIIKLQVGVIAISLALFVQFVSGEVLTSISESYHTRARDWFVGLLFAVAALIVSFRGTGGRERILTMIAGPLAAVVAIAPCECGRVPGVLSKLHFPAAAALFAILGYFCWRFWKSAKAKLQQYPEAGRRAHVYELCLVGMFVCGSMALAFVVFRYDIERRFPNWIFWLEAIGLGSFGMSWLAASRTFPWITNARERYHVLTGRALEDEDGGREHTTHTRKD